MASNTSPLALFMFRLKAPDTRRQYPARLKRFMDLLNIEGSDLEQQCENFVSLTSQSQKYAFESLVSFSDFLNQKARHEEITHGTVNNYYKAVKSFCDMNYAEEPDEYFTFISPEASNAFQSWMDYRQSYGERISPDSWLMRDLWQTTNTKWGARWGLASIPKKIR